MSDDYSPAVALMAAQMEAKTKIREQWKLDGGDLIDAHQFAFSSVASMTGRFSGRKFPEQVRAMEGRMSLTAQFIQGVDVCEASIAEGLYSQAAALLKQELETLAAVDEYEHDRRRDGRTPNIGNGVMRDFGPIYGDLNSISHVSQHDLARQLVSVELGDIRAPTLIPQYNRALAKFLYGNHVFFIIEATRQVERVFLQLFDEGLSKDEQKWLSLAMTILLHEEVIKLAPDVLKRFATREADPTS